MSTKIVVVIFVLFLLAVLLAGSNSVRGAIARTDTSSTTGSTANLVWSHTTSSGDNRFLVVGFMTDNSAVSVDSAKYNSVSMTEIYSHNHGNSCGRIFGLVAPGVGAFNIEVWAGQSLDCGGIATSYTGVHQTADSSTYDSVYSGRGSTGVLPLPAHEGIDGDIGDWLHGFCGSRVLMASLSLGDGQTLNARRLAAISSIVSCYKPAASDADELPITKGTASDDCFYIAFVLNAAAAAGGVTVSPDEAIAAATAIDPTVSSGSITVSLDEAIATATAVDPVILGGPLTISPDEAISVATAVDPTVVLSGGGSKYYVSPADSGGSDVTGNGTKGNPYATISHIFANVFTPNVGDTIMLMVGTHEAEYYILGHTGKPHAFRGTASNYATIMGDPDAATVPLIEYDGVANERTCLAIWARYQNPPNNNNPDNDVAYARIKGLRFWNSSAYAGHSISINDGGNWSAPEDSRGTPAHHIIIEDCTFEYNGYWADGIKFAGVDTFLIQNCEFYAGYEDSPGGNVGPHIDLVGCHYGTILDCTFISDSTSCRGAGIVAKGGSDKITIARCYFEKAGYAGVYIGQNTGASLFRPPLGENDGDGDELSYEAKNIDVYACVFNRNMHSIVFETANRGGVYNCTTYNPIDYTHSWGCSEPLGRNGSAGAINFRDANTYFNYGGWAGYLQHCHRGEWINNIVYRNGSVYGWDCMLHWQTAAPEDSTDTYNFSHNLWHDLQRLGEEPDWAAYGAKCPAHAVDSVGDPLFAESDPDTISEFMLQSSSKAINAGSTYTNLIYDWFNGEYIDGTDYAGDSWGGTMSIGAFGAPGDVSVSPGAAIAKAAAADPIVLIAGNELIAPDAAIAAATATDPTVEQGSLTIAPDAALASAMATDPNVYSGTVTPPETYPALGHYRRRRHL